MAKEVRWSSSAKYDLQKIVSYWNKRNQSTVYTDKLRESLEGALNLITVYPKIGRNTTMTGVRRIVVMKNYGLFYNWTDTSLSILGFWDNRQNPESIKYRIK